MIQGPTWELASEYASPDAPELQADLDRLEALCRQIESLNPELAGEQPVAAARRIFRLREEAGILLQNPSAYANCLLSVNGRDHEAQALQGRLQAHQKRLADATEALRNL